MTTILILLAVIVCEFIFMQVLARRVDRLTAETTRLQGELAVAKLGQRIAMRD